MSEESAADTVDGSAATSSAEVGDEETELLIVEMWGVYVARNRDDGHWGRVSPLYKSSAYRLFGQGRKSCEWWAQDFGAGLPKGRAKTHHIRHDLDRWLESKVH